MSTNVRELLKSQMNVAETSLNNSKSSTPLIQRKKIDNTPFEEITNTESGEKHICLGSFRINKEPLHINQNTTEYLNQNIFDIILTTAIIVGIYKNQ